MDYLPEWKIYLWKKFILNTNGEFDGKLTMANFRFFEPKEQRDLIRERVQKSVDRINIATRAKSLIDLSTSNPPHWEDAYFSFDPSCVFIELVNLDRAGAIKISEIHVDKKLLLFKELFTPDEFGPGGYEKIKQEKELTIADLGYSYSNNYQNNPLFSYLSFKIAIDKKKLEHNLSIYLNDFGKNKFIAPKGVRYIDPQKQCRDFLAALQKLSMRYGQNMTVTPDEIAKAGGWYILGDHHYRFYESIFALEQNKHLTINDLRKEEVILTLNSSVTTPIKLKQKPMKSSISYITKSGDDFLYKGRHLQLSKKSDHYQVFSALYALIPLGGEIEYAKLGQEVQSRVSKAKRYTKDKLQKFLLTNLTDRSNGFMHYAKIPETEDNGKPLISVKRGIGITFNNTAG